MPVYETIEHWYNVHGTGPAVYAGTLCLKGWRPGKQVTEQEYLAAVTAFEKGPMARNGRNKMSLRDVTFVVEDGSLGNSGSTGTGVHVKIGASPVETTVPILITGSMKPEQMKEKLGLSPMADACIDSVENRASRIYCVPVRPETVGTNGKLPTAGLGKGP